MITIKGKISKGHGVAGCCLPYQIEHFVKDLPEIASMFHNGTINVDLEDPVKFLKFDVEIPNITWRGQIMGRPVSQTESFSFVRAGFLPESPKYNNPLPCLLYFASTSPHQFNPFKVEVITEKLSLSGLKDCSIQFDQPFRRVEWVVVGN